MTDEEKQLIISYKETFGSEHGRRVLENLKKLAGYGSVIWKRDSLGRIDPNDVIMRAAKRTVVEHIINQIEKKL